MAPAVRNNLPMERGDAIPSLRHRMKYTGKEGLHNAGIKH